MKKLSIDWSYDEHECETCGCSYSEGAVVKLDDEIILDFPAHAHCFSMVNVGYEDILKSLCEHLNIKIEDNYGMD